MKLVLVRTLIAVWCLLLAVPASATVIISNLGAVVGNGTTINTALGKKDVGWTMGADSYLFDNAIVELNIASASTPLLSIWSGASAPAVQLGALTLSSVGAGLLFKQHTFTAAHTITLAANTTYWLRVGRADGTDQFTWDGRDAFPTGIASNVNYLFDGNPSTRTNSVEINGTFLVDTPEPATLSLFGLGLAALGFAGRRKRAA